MLNITSQQPDPEIEIFVIRVYYEKLSHMLEPLVPTFCSDLYIRLRDFAQKQVSTKLKPIVGPKTALPRFQPTVEAAATARRHICLAEW